MNCLEHCVTHGVFFLFQKFIFSLSLSLFSLSKLNIEMPQINLKNLIGASLSEPHTSVYGGTILLYVRLYVHHTAYALMLQISDNSSHVELTCVFKFTCTST